MGCGGSSDKASDSCSNHGDSDTNIPTRKPKISVRIDTEVRVLDADTPRILFVFGGPGSKKGRVIEDLVRSFGFVYLNSEDIVLEEIPKKLENSAAMELKDARAIYDLIMSQPEQFTFEWVMDCIKMKIESLKVNCYLIDIVPNRRFLAKNANAAETCATALKQFEEKYPISFALNLALPKDKVMRQVEQHTVHKMGAGGGESRSDEVDLSRMQRRIAVYEESAAHFLSYFVDRMCTVDVSCGVADLISIRVSQLLNDMNIKPIRNVNAVVVFTFTENEFNYTNFGNMEVKKIVMKDFIIEESGAENVNELMKLLCRQIDKTPPAEVQVFAASLAGTILERKSGEKSVKVNEKKVLFLEDEHSNLDPYIYVEPSNGKGPHMERRRSSVGRQFRSFATNGNEICLFPMDTDMGLCKYIAHSLARVRTS